jgi:hypothetical protein
MSKTYCQKDSWLLEGGPEEFLRLVPKLLEGLNYYYRCLLRYWPLPEGWKHSNCSGLIGDWRLFRIVEANLSTSYSLFLTFIFKTKIKVISERQENSFHHSSGQKERGSSKNLSKYLKLYGHALCPLIELKLFFLYKMFLHSIHFTCVDSIFYNTF